MKIRTDYVTNSSSSSFIIGKKDDTSATIESVFQTIKGFYKEMIEVREAAIEYITKHPELKMQYVKKDNYETFECTEKDTQKRWKLHDKFKETCGISSWETFYDLDWLDCETYEEYKKYWLNNMEKSNDYYIHAPFTIADFLEEREVDWLHYGCDPEYRVLLHKVNSESATINWYYPYIEEAYKYSKTCDGCREPQYREYCHRECTEARKVIQDKNIPEDKACLYLLGRVCIHSESGYINDYVVDKLHEISEYSCNHMG